MKKILCAIAPCFALACAGSVEGEVDGTALPPLLSGVWTESESGDFVNVSASATSMLDTCGTMIRLFEARTAAVEDMDVNDDDDPSDVIEELNKTLDEVDATVLPEDFWTVTVSMVAEDTDEMQGGSFDQDDFGKEGGMLVVVCHQEGFPDRDSETGVDDNATCYISSESEAEVNSFDDKGGIDLKGEAELVAADDTDDDVGDITLSIRGSACAELDDKAEDFNEAIEDLFEDLGGSPGPIGEGEGEEFCSFDDECFASHELCGEDGDCVTPESVTATCGAADFMFSSDPDGALLFDATIEEGFADCEFPFLFTAAFHDAQGDFNPSTSNVTIKDGNGSTLFVDVVSGEGTSDGAVAISFCANDSFGEVAVQVSDLDLNDSNATCATF
jgi:hypothetical protein